MTMCAMRGRGGVQDFLICIEMFAAAVGFAWSFPPRDYMTGEPPGFWRSFSVLFDLTDVMDDVQGAPAEDMGVFFLSFRLFCCCCSSEFCASLQGGAGGVQIACTRSTARSRRSRSRRSSRRCATRPCSTRPSTRAARSRRRRRRPRWRRCWQARRARRRRGRASRAAQHGKPRGKRAQAACRVKTTPPKRGLAGRWRRPRRTLRRGIRGAKIRGTSSRAR